MPKTALKLVEQNNNQEVYPLRDEFWEDVSGSDIHSLHGSGMLSGRSRAAAVDFLLSRYAFPKARILDPFCGSGTIPLQAALSGFSTHFSDAHPLAVEITAAKLSPADFAMLTIFLQTLQVQAPVDLGLYREYFAPFYDPNTYRELENLRKQLSSLHSDEARFATLLTLDLLHGHSASYCSSYSYPRISLSPEEQRILNSKRRQVPDYRPVIPRILKRGAGVLRDGLSSSFRGASRESLGTVSDARNLHFLASNSIDVILTAPPLPGALSKKEDYWLREWFLNTGNSESGNSESLPFPVRDSRVISYSQGMWAGFMNEALLEFARVVVPGGRVIFYFGKNASRSKCGSFDKELSEMVQKDLARYWDVDAVLIHSRPGSEIQRALNARSIQRSGEERVVVLRRR